MLVTKYKDDKFKGRREYEMIQNDNGTWSFEDVTNYEETGTSVGAADFNEINDFLLNKVYPVGSLFFSTVDINPSDLLGFGTWEPFAQGRTIIGVGTGKDENNTSRTFRNGETGGEYTHQLTVSEIPSHSHGKVPKMNYWVAPSTAQTITTGNSSNEYANTGNAGDNGKHNNIQTYVTCYIYNRIS